MIIYLQCDGCGEKEEVTAHSEPAHSLAKAALARQNGWAVREQRGTIKIYCTTECEFLDRD